MSRIFVAGIGAVSPAGWTVTALREALDKNEPLPVQSLPRPGWDKPLHARIVPNPPMRPEFLAHPRLRRASSITHYVASAALEAMAGLRANATIKNLRLGIISCFQSGCVQYTCRFYDETLKNPATASPLVFPETVYAAPTSHVAALLENVVLAYSLVGDPSSYLNGVALATEWLNENRVDACLVIGAEETHWIIADALIHLERPATLAAGAGALCLCHDSRLSAGVELAAITDAHTITKRLSVAQAAQAMRRQLGAHSPGELLVDGAGSSPECDRAELAAWNDSTSARVSPKHILGEGMMAAAAWQCVAACDYIAQKRHPAAAVSLVGFNQQAIGARFVQS